MTLTHPESATAKYIKTRPPTVDDQSSLPRLPLPTLEDTGRRFIEWCEPLLSASELHDTKVALERFMRKGGPAEMLQEALVAYDREPGVRSWLDLFWQTRYLGRRDRIALNANVFLLFPDLRMSQTRRAAALIARAIEFKRSVDEERLPVERWRGRPLCMEQYKYLFSTTRHILVFHKGHIVRMDVIGSDGAPYRLDDIEHGLDAVKASIEAPAATEESVGHFTTLARAEWASARAELITAHPDNAAALETIETALFNVCLDEVAPEDHLAVCNNLLFGSSADRWYDKAVSLIVTANGAAGVNAEHCMLDGMALMGFVDALHAENGAEHSVPTSEGMPAFARLQFKLTEDLRRKTRDAAQSFKAYGDTTAAMLYAFDAFGASRVKEFGFSP